MGFPESNLPSLDGQRYYMVVQETRYPFAKSERDVHPCHEKENATYGGFKNTHKYFVHSMRILRVDNNDTQAYVDYDRYMIQFNSSDQQYYSEAILGTYRDAIYSVGAQQQEGFTALTRAVHAALYYAFNPLERASFNYYIPHILSNAFVTEQSVQLSRKVIQVLLEKKENSFNRIDREHVALLMRNNTAESLHAQIKYIYVNVVYDCHTMCSQSVLSDGNTFTSSRHYGLLCTRGLLEFSGLLNTQNEQKKASVVNSTVRPFKNVTLEIMDTNGNEQQSCGLCVQNILPIAVGAIVAVGSTIAIFTKVSNSKCAKAVRSCFGSASCALLGIRKIQRYAETQVQITEKEGAEQVDDLL